jgi:hypothetical protein
MDCNSGPRLRLSTMSDSSVGVREVNGNLPTLPAFMRRGARSQIFKFAMKYDHHFVDELITKEAADARQAIFHDRASLFWAEEAACIFQAWDGRKSR